MTLLISAFLCLWQYALNNIFADPTVLCFVCFVLSYLFICYCLWRIATNPNRADFDNAPGMIIRSQQSQHPELLVTIAGVPYNHTASPEIVFFSPVLPHPVTGIRSRERFVETLVYCSFPLQVVVVLRVGYFCITLAIPFCDLCAALDLEVLKMFLLPVALHPRSRCGFRMFSTFLLKCQIAVIKREFLVEQLGVMLHLHIYPVSTGKCTFSKRAIFFLIIYLLGTAQWRRCNGGWFCKRKVLEPKSVLAVSQVQPSCLRERSLPLTNARGKST